jgi:branched-chain amino acid transport system substrate-binding protein
MRGRIGIAAGLTALALAGCSSGSDAPGTESVAAETPPTTTVAIVSDLPMQGLPAEQTNSMKRAIELYLDQIGYRVGDIAIDYRPEDSSAYGVKNGEAISCRALEYRDDESVVGVVGPFNSGCAKVLLPILNELSIAVVSPSNTDDGLTHSGPSTAKDEPERYYPTGIRTYARVVPPDDVQARAGAEAMASLGATKACVLDDRTDYGRAIANGFVQAAGDFGLAVVCRLSWREKPAGADYLGLMERVKASGADGIYLGGVSDYGGAELIRDKVTEVGDNETVKLVVADGFLTNELFDDAGAANVEGIYATSPVVMTNGLTGLGKVFAADYAERYGEAPATYAPYAAAAAQVLVDAIGRSDGTRADIAAKVLATALDEGILGPTSFDPNGDRVDAPVPLFQARDGAWVYLD